MDRKLKRFELCSKLHEKIPIRREITLFLKVSKMANSTGKPHADFLVELRKAKKIAKA